MYRCTRLDLELKSGDAMYCSRWKAKIKRWQFSVVVTIGLNTVALH